MAIETGEFWRIMMTSQKRWYEETEDDSSWNWKYTIVFCMWGFVYEKKTILHNKTTKWWKVHPDIVYVYKYKKM